MGFHSKEIHEIFHDSWVGSDLEFAEIKSNSRRKIAQFDMRKKDYTVELLLFWDKIENMGYICYAHDFEVKKSNHSSILLSVIKRLAFFSCNSLIELKNEYDRIVKEKDF